ncbi:MAG TPA: hypothetical protein VNO32_27280, partial [Candidatus Acidoferrum sp.]|nr:hypothetical protein [Candidatus Acidoferrum sp.]
GHGASRIAAIGRHPKPSTKCEILDRSKYFPLCTRKQTSASAAAMTNPDPNPFADCDAIVCCSGAKVTAKHLASTIHCIDDEIIGWLKRREQASLSCFGRPEAAPAPRRKGAKAYRIV